MTDKTEREHKERMRKSKEELKGREKDEKHYTKCKRSPTKGPTKGLTWQKKKSISHTLS